MSNRSHHPAHNRVNNRWTLLIALLLPIAVLAANAWFHHQQRATGTELILPVRGFDPRDLLSGHYLIYEIDFGIDEDHGCPTSHVDAIACLSPERQIFPSDELPESCTQFIKGSCDDNARFTTGLERFYVPEEYAKRLEKHVINNQGKLVISLDNAGNAATRDLLINDQPWKEIIDQQD